MHSRLRTLAIATASLLLATTTTGAAAPAPAPSGDSADSGQSAHPSVRRVRDARHDVRRVTEREGGEALSPAPSRRHGDITALRVAHAQDAVLTRVRLRSLTRHDRLFGAVVQLRTAEATYSAVVFRLLPTQRFQVSFDGGGLDSCAGLRYHLDYRRDTVTVRLPRTCLGTPNWVRARAVIDYFGPRGRNDVFYADAAPGSSLDPVPFLARVWRP
ncbi:exported hypothetical protein [metagenome]|uniref:Uncharacterized protein n=1 Tax=metagenome TaxID=256318 RepID=A0A2P2CC88_9ZZZZ